MDGWQMLSVHLLFLIRERSGLQIQVSIAQVAFLKAGVADFNQMKG
jgi:hypothetical protein